MTREDTYGSPMVSGALETSPKLSHDSLKDELVVRNGANNEFMSFDEGRQWQECPISRHFLNGSRMHFGPTIAVQQRERRLKPDTHRRGVGCAPRPVGVLQDGR